MQVGGLWVYSDAQGDGGNAVFQSKVRVRSGRFGGWDGFESPSFVLHSSGSGCLELGVGVGKGSIVDTWELGRNGRTLSGTPKPAFPLKQHPEHP